MNDRDRDMIQLVLKEAGEAGKQGFGYLTHFYAVDGMVGLLCCAVILAACVWAIRRLLSWETDDEASMARGAAIVVCCIVFIVFVVCGGDALTEVLAPEGAAIHGVLTK